MLKQEPSSKPGIHFMTRIAYLFAFLSLLTLVTSNSSFNGTSQASADNSTGSGYTQDQLDALDFLNSVRAKVGVPPVKLNVAITRAAENHASHYNDNKSQLTGLKAHSEIEGGPGFTGTKAKDRLIAAGYTASSKYGLSTGEVMHFNQKSSSEAMQGWLDTAYHRDIILDPYFSEIGIGLVDGTAVVDMAGPTIISSKNDILAVYPYNQQTNVPVGFYGQEIPNPLDRFKVKFSGYIISATAEDTITNPQVEIKDNLGNAVPYYEELQGNTLFVYPKSVLKGHHTYTVSLTYSTSKNAESKSKTWSFTTGEGQALNYFEPFTTEITLNQDEQQQTIWISHYDDTTADEKTEGMRYISSNDKGLRISASGMITAIKPGDYTIKATLEGQTSLVKVKVYPKWKTKNYSSALKALPLDSTGHSLRETLEWGLKEGIITPASNGKLKPDATVSEAEFWMMLLKTYRVNITSYQSGKQTLVDAAYQISKDRNYPLAGIAKKEKRNQPIDRLEIAEIVAAADGMYFNGYNAVQYVLAKGYVRGVTELSYAGYEGDRNVTKAEALVILKHLQGSLYSLKGRPLQPTDKSALPEMPQKEVYIKPATYKDQSFFAQYELDGRLILEGKFLSLKGQSVVIKVQEGPVSVHIEDITVQFDETGNFHAEVGPYTPQRLNLYLSDTSKSSLRFLSVEKGTINQF
ncbi:Ig-like domain-containing protein [Paenibacillus barcinonensis]|uniref:Ig-like domain-containing protein n=1 Tax=Paenibacillus barcinonensis TaxID=198119 RepID=A0A2V4VQR6_PAEBA|nr:uncharacterized protein YkwD [Paenibacillus barcinonensis]QKS57710.1 Ig-like domain-containing protein [Paenibacillus barcinonensis]